MARWIRCGAAAAVGTILLVAVTTPSPRAQETGQGAVVEGETAGVAADSTGGPSSSSPTSSSPTSSSTVILPILGYTPDTSLLVGASLIRFFHIGEPGPDGRTSIFSPVFVYTAKNQILAFLGTEFYWDRGLNHMGVVSSYVKFPDVFFGIGRDSRREDEEDYTPESISFEFLLERAVAGYLRLGVTMRGVRHRVTKVTEGGQLDSGAVAGARPTILVAPGALATWDSRDNVWSARRGDFAQFGVGLASTAVGSDFDFARYHADLRSFRSIWAGHVLAAQILITSLVGDTPFFALPQLGGEEGLRGYTANRFIDSTRALARVEYRWNGLWGNLSGVVFFGGGDVAPRLGALRLNLARPSYGFGFRYLIEKEQQLKIRLDFGFGEDDSGFFLTLGEAF